MTSNMKLVISIFFSGKTTNTYIFTSEITCVQHLLFLLHLKNSKFSRKIHFFQDFANFDPQKIIIKMKLVTSNFFLNYKFAKESPPKFLEPQHKFKCLSKIFWGGGCSKTPIQDTPPEVNVRFKSTWHGMQSHWFDVK